MKQAVCGIDFGTSNSTVALAGGTAAAGLVRLEGDKTTLPSAIFFRDGVGPVFGRAGINAYLEGQDGRLIRGLKKILGTPLMADKTFIGSRAVNFTEILAVFINHLKAQAESAAGMGLDHVVMGRPVHFHDNNHDADQVSQDTLVGIAAQAGFKHIEFLYEPIAAAFAHEADVTQEKLAFVIDLGGGTSDFTVIRIGPDRINQPDRRSDILATSGVRVGGTTFDYRLSLKGFMPYLGLGSLYHDMFDRDKWLHVPQTVFTDLSDWALVHQAQTTKAISQTKDIARRADEPEKIARLLYVQEQHLGHALLETVEEAKIALTQEEQHTAVLKALADGHRFKITRKTFEAAIRADVAKIFTAMDECLRQAGLTAADIELVILTGGSTELPVINQMVAARFPQAQMSRGNKLDSVGRGLAYHAAHMFGAA